MLNQGEESITPPQATSHTPTTKNPPHTHPQLKTYSSFISVTHRQAIQRNGMFNQGKESHTLHTSTNNYTPLLHPHTTKNL